MNPETIPSALIEGENWELYEDAEDGSWASYRLTDSSYSLWAIADSTGFWQTGHSTWSREEGHEDHEDREGQTDDQTLAPAQAAAEAALVEQRGWLDEYERQMRECEAAEAISEEEMARLQLEDEACAGYPVSHLDIESFRGEVI
jgi:hypothetical protein